MTLFQVFFRSLAFGDFPGDIRKIINNGDVTFVIVDGFIAYSQNCDHFFFSQDGHDQFTDHLRMAFG